MSVLDVGASLERVSRHATVDELCALLDRDGAVVIEQMWSADVLAAINAEIDVLSAQTAPGSKYGEVEGGHHGSNTRRINHLVALSPTFRERMITDPLIHAVARARLTAFTDSFWLSAAQVIEIGPGNAMQPLHRDMETVPAFRQYGPDGPEVMVNFLSALNDFTPENGATRIIPRSNHWPDYSRVDRRDREGRTIPADLRAGDAVLMSGKIVHGGGANVTTDQWRRGLAMSFCPGFIVPEEAHPFFVPMEIVRTLPPEVQHVLGFRSFHARVAGGGSLWQDGYDELGDHLGL
jgi:ectoine hydroxylase-related dioxygenase (phytanoyl-CoA dioxygenase family)